MSQCRRGGAWVSGVLVLASVWVAPAAWAQFDFTPFVSVGHEYDSNVFRLRNEEEALALNGTRKRSDEVTTYSAGAQVLYTAGPQRFSFNGSGNRVRYAENDDLDFEGYTFGSALDWQLGSRLTGRAAWDRSRALRDFETQLGSNERSLLQTTVAGLDATLQVASEWRLLAGGGDTRTRNSGAISRQDDRDETEVRGGIDYVGFGAFTIGTRASRAQGDFPNREPVAGVAEEFEQIDYSLNASWRPSGISTFNAAVGRSERENQGVEDTEFSGFTGSFGYVRTISAKTSLNLQTYRSVSSDDQQGSNFVINRGGVLTLNWQPTPTLSVSGNVGLNNLRFEDSPALDVDGETRKDRDKSVGLELGYSPVKWMSISPSVSHQRRSSNLDAAEYRSTRYGIVLQAQLPN